MAQAPLEEWHRLPGDAHADPSSIVLPRPTSTSSSPRPPAPAPTLQSITSPVKRKPVGSAASASSSSPRAAAPAAFDAPRRHVASPSHGAPSGLAIARKAPPTSRRAESLSSLQQQQHQQYAYDLPPPPVVFSPEIPQSPSLTPFHELPEDEARALLNGLDGGSFSLPRAHVRSSDPPRSLSTSVSRPHPPLQRADTMPTRAGGPSPIQILPVHDVSNNGLSTPNQNGGSKFGSFFSWKGKLPHSPINESTPTTTISDRSSPAQSPNGTSLTSFPPSGKMLPAALDTSRTTIPSAALFTGSSTYPPAPPTPALQYQVEELEEELRDISTELANSIRREMELEDQVERLQTEGPNALEKEKRTSDYFSDSGTSSNRDAELPVLVHGDDAERSRRRSEQAKAEMKLDLSRKLQEERSQRRKLEEHVRSLEDHIRGIEQGRAPGVHVVELERRLSQEKKHKENVQDMVKALRDDLENHKNERDNLRDEVVPSLRARVEGLEAEAAEHQKLQYEHTRMQQELQALKAGRVPPINEEDGSSTGRTRGLTRSGSMLRSAGGLARSGSIIKSNESRETLLERVKDTEEQRDALHRALKGLLDRQRVDTRAHEKLVRALELERDAALESQSTRRKGYEKEVKDLRHEIDHLRRRADDALAQKWQCEKGLGSLKMDLDRAETETESLRQLLQAKDVIVPDSAEAAGAMSMHATSQTLEKAYRELASARTQAESLRDAAAFTADERDHLSKQLRAAGERVEVLSTQVQRQLTQNTELRERLSHAVIKGEDEQKTSTVRISELQARLRSLEDQLSSAQQQSEDSVQAHEEDVRDMRLNEDRRLLRLKTSHSNLQSPRISVVPASPFSPAAPRTPRLDRTSSGPGVSFNDAHQTEQLESRVRELEQALRDTEGEMSEVVQRMNFAQMEVLELQTARDDAQKMTRALQSQLEAEQASMGSLTRSLAA